MAIEKEQLEYEKHKLAETLNWIEELIEQTDQKKLEMESKVANLKVEAGGTYSVEYEIAKQIKAATDRNYENYLESKVQPYFARIDFREYKHSKDTYYIGKFGLMDENTLEEKVIDWRAPISDVYYSGTEGECFYDSPSGIISGELFLKRKFLIKDNVIVDAFDEGINEIILNTESSDDALVDDFLKTYLEESVSKKLKDVVATIQKEQNKIIREHKNIPIIVQGSAGSGKTTIALHRLAYILYRYKDKIKGDDILVIAPNALFLDYISEVLPSLGVSQVKQSTFEEISLEILKIKSKIFTKEEKISYLIENEEKEDINYTKLSSRFKGSLVFKNIIDRYIKIIEKENIDIDSIKIYDYVIFDKNEIKRLFFRDLERFPINKRIEEIKKHLNNKLKEKTKDVISQIEIRYEREIAQVKKEMKDSLDRNILIDIYDKRDNEKEYVKKNIRTEFSNYFKEWKVKNIKELYYDLLKNENILNEITNGKLDEKLITFMKDEISKNEKIIDSDDLASMLYMKLRIDGLSDDYKFEHIVIDEAQDYSLMQFEVLKYLSYNNSFTIVGDIGQGIYDYKGLENWDRLINEIFNGEISYDVLTHSYRSTVEIINFANKVLKKQKFSIEPAKPVLRHGLEPEIIEISDDSYFLEKVQEIVEITEKMGKRSVAIVGRNMSECKKIGKLLKKQSGIRWNEIGDNENIINFDKIIIPAYMTKGLEFDCVIVYNCNDENYKNDEFSKKLLYVILTRALHLEYVFYSGKKSVLLGE